MHLAEVRAEIEPALTAALQRATERLVAAAPSLAEPARLLAQSNVGGKRIRPVLVLIGHQLLTGTREPAMGPALATEFLHLCALLHDDVIDAAETRRGHAAFHVAAADAHRQRRWRGDPDAHGQAAAILFGDLAFVLADEAFFDSTSPAAPLVQAHRVFTQMREEVMRGQYLDVVAAASASASIEDALAIARDKSGRYTITRPLEIGAVLAGAAPPVVAALHAWGDPLGIAFQLTDDLLGVLGDADRTGKDPSTDLREGKRTVLVAEALAALDAEAGARLDRLLGTPNLSDDEVTWMRETIAASNAPEAVRGRIRALVTDAEQALTELADLEVEPSAVGLLEELTRELADRDH